MPSKKKRKAKNKQIDPKEIFQQISKSTMHPEKFRDFVEKNKKIFLTATQETNKHGHPFSPLEYALEQKNYDYTAILIDLNFPIENQCSNEEKGGIAKNNKPLIYYLLKTDNDKINRALLKRFQKTPNVLIDGVPLLFFACQTSNTKFAFELLKNPQIDTFKRHPAQIANTPLGITLFNIAIRSNPKQLLQRSIPGIQLLPQPLLQELTKNERETFQAVEKKILEVRKAQNQPTILKEELQSLLNKLLQHCDSDALKIFKEITKEYPIKLSSLDFSINNQGPIHIAASLGKLGNCIQLIFESPELIYSLTDLSKETALQAAALSPNFQITRLLINKHKAFCAQEKKPPGFIEDYVNYTSLSGLPTALLAAVTQKNNRNTIQVLVEEDASVELGDRRNHSALQIALGTCFFEYIPFLATKNTVNLASQHGLPIHILFKSGAEDKKKLEILELLLQKGADPTLSSFSTTIKQAYFEKKPEGIVTKHLGRKVLKCDPLTENEKQQSVFKLLKEKNILDNKAESKRNDEKKEIKRKQKKEAQEDKEMLENAFKKMLYPLEEENNIEEIKEFYTTHIPPPLFQLDMFNFKSAIKLFHQYNIDLNFRFCPEDQNELEHCTPLTEKRKDLLSITLLLFSIIKKNDEITQSLINSECDLKLGFLNSDLTPFLTAIVMGNSERVIKLLCGKSVLDQKQIEKAICLAAYMNNVVIVKFLLETAKKKNYFLNLNATENTHGLTALSCAAFQNSTECARLLLENNASPNVPVGPRQETPLFQAVKNNNPEMIADLIRHGAKTDCYNKHGFTPLHYAIIFGNLKTLKALLPHCSIDLSTKFENSLDGIRDFSPLQFAIFLGRTRIAQTLIKNGADVNYQTSTGETAFDLTNKYRIGYAVIEKLKRKHDQTQASEKDEIKTAADHADDIKFSNNNSSFLPQKKITGRKFLIEMGFTPNEIKELQKSFEEEDEIKTEDEDKSIEENKTSWEYMGRLLTPKSEGVVPMARSNHFCYFFIDKTKIEEQKCPSKLIQKFSNLRAKSADKQGADGYCHFTNQNRPKDIHSGFFIERQGKNKELRIDGELKIFSKKGKGASRLFCVSIPPNEKGGAPLTAAIKYLPKGLH